MIDVEKQMLHFLLLILTFVSLRNECSNMLYFCCKYWHLWIYEMNDVPKCVIVVADIDIFEFKKWMVFQHALCLLLILTFLNLRNERCSKMLFLLMIFTCLKIHAQTHASTLKTRARKHTRVKLGPSFF